MNSEAEKLVADAIENAEEIREPLEDLVEKVATDSPTLNEAIVEGSNDTSGSQAKAGRHTDRTGASRRAFPRSRWHRLWRRLCQWSPRDLADSEQWLQAVAAASLFRDDWRRAEFGGIPIGAQRHRGQGAF